MADRHILCIYYSRSGKTRRAMEAVAATLEAELVELTDGVDRRGSLRAVAACFDAVRRSTRPLEPFRTERPLDQYDLVILGTPVWAGRCTPVIREFLKKYGQDLHRVAYVLTRGGKRKYEEVCRQMDQYTAAPHLCHASLQAGSAGEAFWRAEFIRQIRGAVPC